MEERDTTSKEFKIIRDSFNYFRKKFGFGHYRSDVALEQTDDKDAMAEILVDVIGAFCKLRVSPTINSGDSYPMKKYGKHEAVHLLLAPLKKACLTKGATDEWVQREEEDLVWKLVELLKD